MSFSIGSNHKNWDFFLVDEPVGYLLNYCAFTRPKSASNTKYETWIGYFHGNFSSQSTPHVCTQTCLRLKKRRMRRHHPSNLTSRITLLRLNQNYECLHFNGHKMAITMSLWNLSQVFFSVKITIPIAGLPGYHLRCKFFQSMPLQRPLTRSKPEWISIHIFEFIFRSIPNNDFERWLMKSGRGLPQPTQDKLMTASLAFLATKIVGSSLPSKNLRNVSRVISFH